MAKPFSDKCCTTFCFGEDNRRKAADGTLTYGGVTHKYTCGRGGNVPDGDMLDNLISAEVVCSEDAQKCMRDRTSLNDTSDSFRERLNSV